VVVAQIGAMPVGVLEGLDQSLPVLVRVGRVQRLHHVQDEGQHGPTGGQWRGDQLVGTKAGMQGNFPANTAKKEFKSWVLNGFSDG